MARKDGELPASVRREIEMRMRRISDLERKFQQMESCGIECQQLRESARSLYDEFTTVYDVYFGSPALGEPTTQDK